MDKFDKHLQEVVNQCWNFAGRISTPEGHQMMAMVGLAAEAGEALDVQKKMAFHTPKDRRDDLRSELGDVIFYWLKAVEVFGFTTDEVLADNRAKLESRHPELGKVQERFGASAIK